MWKLEREKPKRRVHGGKGAGGEMVRNFLAKLHSNYFRAVNLKAKAMEDGYVYAKVRKGMYGLPQAGILAQKLLQKRLNAEGYFQSKITPDFSTYKLRPICFTLVVDDFGVKYTGEEHVK